MTTKTNKSSNHCLIICCGQGLVVCHCLIICCGQGLVPSYCFITFATKTKFHSPKRAFARFYHLPWSGVGGLLLSYHLLWSGVGGQLLFYHMCHQNQISPSKTSVLRDFIICRGLGLVVCYCLIICCGQGLVICHQKQIS